MFGLPEFIKSLSIGGNEAPMLLGHSDNRATGNHCGRHHRKGAKRDMRRDGRARNVGGQIANWPRKKER